MRLEVSTDFTTQEFSVNSSTVPYNIALTGQNKKEIDCASEATDLEFALRHFLVAFRNRGFGVTRHHFDNFRLKFLTHPF